MKTTTSERTMKLTKLQAARIERLAFQLDMSRRQVFDMLLEHAVITLDSLLANNCIIGPSPLCDDGDFVFTHYLDKVPLAEIIRREEEHESEHYEPLQRIIALQRGHD